MYLSQWPAVVLFSVWIKSIIRFAFVCLLHFAVVAECVSGLLDSCCFSFFSVGSARYMRFFFSCFSHISFSRIFYVYVAIDLRSFISDGLWSFGVCIFFSVVSCCVSVYNVFAVSCFVLHSFDAYCFVQRYWKYNWQFTSEKRSHNIVSLLTIIKYGNLTRFIVH